MQLALYRRILIIDKKGVVRYVSIGNPEGSVDKLAAEIKKLLAE